ncbi:hypothetical protein CAI16_05845 [Virgibacillus dokdonensis]|uniref:Uncharacterized protein n=1 Tax=Virgibacillus dokdonensis TaxID=302167 RepID=A0A3E0WVJ0_9BACI|nr:hypothetical protein [Virgibacillus dokdonensis]RFA35957.1 hypothetical protein CAI16_05845 [Virgibacillus dokdonensis]
MDVGTAGIHVTTNNSSKKFRITLKKGGFGVNTHTWGQTPLDVFESFNLPLSGSPYTIRTHQYFYFLVDDPNPGQTYKVTAIR